MESARTNRLMRPSFQTEPELKGGMMPRQNLPKETHLGEMEDPEVSRRVNGEIHQRAKGRSQVDRIPLHSQSA